MKKIIITLSFVIAVLALNAQTTIGVTTTTNEQKITTTGKVVSVPVTVNQDVIKVDKPINEQQPVKTTAPVPTNTDAVPLYDPVYTPAPPGTTNPPPTGAKPMSTKDAAPPKY